MDVKEHSYHMFYLKCNRPSIFLPWWFFLSFHKTVFILFTKVLKKILPCPRFKTNLISRITCTDDKYRKLNLLIFVYVRRNFNVIYIHDSKHLFYICLGLYINKKRLKWYEQSKGKRAKQWALRPFITRSVFFVIEQNF